MTRLRLAGAAAAAAALTCTIALQPTAAVAEPKPSGEHSYLGSALCVYPKSNKGKGDGVVITVSVLFKGPRPAYETRAVRVTVVSNADVPSTVYVYENKRDTAFTRPVGRPWKARPNSTTHKSLTRAKMLPVGSNIIVQVWSPRHGTCQATLINTDL